MNIVDAEIEKEIQKLSSMLKTARLSSVINRMKNGATMQKVDKPNVSGKNKGKKRPLFSKSLNEDNPYNTR